MLPGLGAFLHSAFLYSGLCTCSCLKGCWAPQSQGHVLPPSSPQALVSVPRACAGKASRVLRLAGCPLSSERAAEGLVEKLLSSKNSNAKSISPRKELKKNLFVLIYIHSLFFHYFTYFYYIDTFIIIYEFIVGN